MTALSTDFTLDTLPAHTMAVLHALALLPAGESKAALLALLQLNLIRDEHGKAVNGDKLGVILGDLEHRGAILRTAGLPYRIAPAARNAVLLQLMDEQAELSAWAELLCEHLPLPRNQWDVPTATAIQLRLWLAILHEAELAVRDEPLLASFLHMTVLRHATLEDVLAFHLSSKLASPVMDARALMELFREAFAANPAIIEAVRADITACYERDPACDSYSTPLLYFKGFHALQSQRVTHWLWQEGRKTLAYFLQNRISEVMGADIHPAARIGHGVMLDHGTGIVVGETAVIGNNVSILQGVTLGGTGKEGGDRHPKVRSGVMIGAGAKILGNIEIGEGAKVGAGSIVLHPVAPHTTVVGNPARQVGKPRHARPALDMDQSFDGDS